MLREGMPRVSLPATSHVMHVCVYIYTYTRIHAHTYTYIYIHITRVDTLFLSPCNESRPPATSHVPLQRVTSRICNHKLCQTSPSVSYTHTHTYIYVNITYICTHTHTHAHTHASALTRTHTHTHTHLVPQECVFLFLHRYIVWGGYDW